MFLPVFHDGNRNFGGKSIIDILADGHFLDHRPPIVVGMQGVGHHAKGQIEHCNIYCAVGTHKCQFIRCKMTIIKQFPSSGRLGIWMI